MLYYQRLINSFKRGVVSPIYLFYGEEIYLREQAVNQFKRHLLPAGEDFNMDVVDGDNTTPGAVVNFACTPPFMAERRLVLVKNAPWFASGRKTAGAGNHGGDVKVLLDYFSNPMETTCLVFTAGAVDKRKKVFKGLEKAGQAVEFILLKPGELTNWLDEQMQVDGKKMDRQAKELLVTATNTGLTGLIHEWEKLKNYTGTRDTITVDDVNKVVHRSVEYKIFDVMDAIGAQQYGLALAGIKDLLANKEPPQIILAMVARQFRLMLQVKELAGGGMGANAIAKLINEKPYPVRNALKLGKNFTRLQLIDAITRLAQLDADVKTGRQEFYAGLEILLLSMAS